MKTIILARHAKAASRKLDIPDFDRPLQKKGQKDAKRIAAILNSDGIQADLLISSPANRALETAHIFAKELGYPIQKIVIKDTLYNETSPQKILEMVREVDEKYSSIMIFGHNPSFDDFANFLSPKFKESISTTGVVGLRCKNMLWKTIARGKGEVQFYEYPIRKTEKHQIHDDFRGKIEVRIANQVKRILAEIDRNTTANISEQIEQYSKKLANKFLNATQTYKAKRISETLPSKRQAKKSSGKSKTDVKKEKGSAPQKKQANQGKPNKTKTEKNPTAK